MDLQGRPFKIHDDETHSPALFWTNPFTGKDESLCRFHWPTHPKEWDVDGWWSRVSGLILAVLNHSGRDNTIYDDAAEYLGERDAALSRDGEVERARGDVIDLAKCCVRQYPNTPSGLRDAVTALIKAEADARKGGA